MYIKIKKGKYKTIGKLFCYWKWNNGERVISLGLFHIEIFKNKKMYENQPKSS
jgi:hypothetical protein